MQQSPSISTSPRGLAYLTPTKSHSLSQNMYCFFSLQFQLPSECTILSLISFFSLQFQIISNTIRMHHLPSLFSFYSLQFQIVLSTVTMHALETLLTSISLQFKIVSNTVRMYECTKAYM